MVTSIILLETQLLESLSREQLLGRLSERRTLLPLPMTMSWLDRQSTCNLRMLLLAAKVIDAVWHLDATYIDCRSTRPRDPWQTN